MGKDHKKPLFGPDASGLQISSSAWDRSWSPSPSPFRPADRSWEVWDGQNLVAGPPPPPGRPATDRTQDVPNHVPSGPEAYGARLNGTNKPSRAENGRGDREVGPGEVANWSLLDRSPGSGRFLFTFLGPVGVPCGRGGEGGPFTRFS